MAVCLPEPYSQKLWELWLLSESSVLSPPRIIMDRLTVLSLFSSNKAEQTEKISHKFSRYFGIFPTVFLGLNLLLRGDWNIILNILKCSPATALAAWILLSDILKFRSNINLLKYSKQISQTSSDNTCLAVIPYKDNNLEYTCVPWRQVKCDRENPEYQNC